ncbi:MAG: hypothetical protein ACHQVS_02110 [Candidatus Babeliales bacterium]
MNAIIKTSLWCILACLITPITVHAGEEVKKKMEEVPSEALSWSDNLSIKMYGNESFTKTSNYIRLTPGQKKTFFEEWIQHGINNNLFMDMCNARRNAVSAGITINSQLLAQAAEIITRDMHEGMIFLTKTLPAERVHGIGKDLEKLSTVKE